MDSPSLGWVCSRVSCLASALLSSDVGVGMKSITRLLLVIGVLAALAAWLTFNRPAMDVPKETQAGTSTGSAEGAVDGEAQVQVIRTPTDPDVAQTQSVPEQGQPMNAPVPGSELVRHNTNPNVPGSGLLSVVDAQEVLEGDFQAFLDALATDADGFVHRSGFQNTILQIPVVASGAVVLDRLECSSLMCAARFLAFDDSDLALLGSQWQSADGPQRFSGIQKDLPEGGVITRQMIFSVDPDVRGAVVDRDRHRPTP